MKGALCLEGFWYGDHRDKTSVIPILELANRFLNMPYIHHRCGTIAELEFSLQRWNTKSFYKKYPILILAFHGKKGNILIGKENISLEMLAEMLGEKSAGSVIYFGSCETMNVTNKRLQSFMQKTHTLAVLGYKKEVDWLKSASFEIQLLAFLLDHPLDTQGIKKIAAEIQSASKHDMSELNFKIAINEKDIFRRVRKQV